MHNRLAVVLVAVLVGCVRQGFDDDDVSPALTVSQDLIAFGSTGVGFSTAQLVSVAPITGKQVRSLTVESIDTPFGIAGGVFPGARGTCPSGVITAPCDIDFQFAPTELGTFTGVLTFRYESGGRVHRASVALSGQGAAIGTVPDAVRSSVSGTTPVLADGIEASHVVVILHDAEDRPVPGFTPTITLSGGANVIEPCTVGDGAGRSECEARSTRAETKTVSIATPVQVLGNIIEFTGGSVVSIAFTRQPVVSQVGAVFDVGPQVTLYDVQGNVIDEPLDVALTVVGAGGGIAGDSTRTAIAGVVDFTAAGLRLERGGTLQLRATAANGVTALSSSLVLGLPALSSIAVFSGPLSGIGYVDGPSGTARILSPYGGASDGTYLYFAELDACTIRRVELTTGTVDTLAGTPFQCGLTNDVGTAARFNRPFGLAVSGNDLYVSEINNNAIRHIDLTTRAVTTLAGGNPRTGVPVNGPGASAVFCEPAGLALDATYVYVADKWCHDIRRVARGTGFVEQIIGSGVDGNIAGTGLSAGLSAPVAVAITATDLYIGEFSAMMRSSLATFDTSQVLAGFHEYFGYSATANTIYTDNLLAYDLGNGSVVDLLPSSDPSSYVDGPLATARINVNRGVIAVGSVFYVLDPGDGSIRRVDVAGNQVSTLVGIPGAGHGGHVDGPAASMRFVGSNQVASTHEGIYVRDQFSIRRLDPSTGNGVRYAGNENDPFSGNINGPAADARLSEMRGFATDGRRLFTMSRRQLRVVDTATDIVSTIAGSGAPGNDDGTGEDARFNDPRGMAYHDGAVYVGDLGVIRRVDTRTGTATTVLGDPDERVCDNEGVGTATGRVNWPGAMVQLGNALYFVDCDRLKRLDMTTGKLDLLGGNFTCAATDGSGTGAILGCGEMALSSDGVDLYVILREQSLLRRIQVSPSLTMTTIAGVSIDPRDVDGSFANARFLAANALHYGYGVMWTANDFNVRRIIP